MLALPGFRDSCTDASSAVYEDRRLAVWDDHPLDRQLRDPLEWRRKPLANRELWERLRELDGCFAVSWRQVRGHRPKGDTSDNARYNREVDELAVEARRGLVVPTPTGLGQ